MVFPTYSEWLPEMKTLLVRRHLEIDDDESGALYVLVSGLLRPSLEISPDHYNDYNSAVDSCIQTINGLSGLVHFAAIAYVNALKNSRDNITSLVADNIRKLLKVSSAS